MRHIPVLLQNILEGLNIDSLKQSKSVPVVIDCNLGDGGHSEEIIASLNGKVHLIGFDLDPNAIQRATENIEKRVKEEIKKDKSFSKPTLTFINENFRTLKNMMTNQGVEQVDAILFDLGISSYELEESGRGFSFQKDEPLRMTFGDPAKHPFTAWDIVNTWDEEHIADIIYAYGEDKFSRRIAKAILEKRENKPIETTKELAEIVKLAYPGFARHGRIHPATRTFQAIRIAVNDELRSIEDALPQAVELLRTGGRLAVISFHSLEDRIIKNFFRKSSGRLADADIDHGTDYMSDDKDAETPTLKLLVKKPITPDEDEISINPRSRSSKLRIAEKI